VVGLRASGGVGSSRKRETNALVPLVSAGRPHRRPAIDGDLLPSRRSGQRARLAGSPRLSATTGAPSWIPGVDLKRNSENDFSEMF